MMTDEEMAASGWLCTCFEGWVSAMCPFHAPVIPFPEVSIKRGGVLFPIQKEDEDDSDRD